MTTKTNISLEFANDILFHIGGEKPLSKSEITNRMIEIRNTLSELLPVITKLEHENKVLKQIKSDAIKRMETISRDNVNVDYHLMIAKRVELQLVKDNEELRERLLTAESLVLKNNLMEQEKF